MHAELSDLKLFKRKHAFALLCRVRACFSPCSIRLIHDALQAHLLSALADEKNFIAVTEEEKNLAMAYTRLL